MRLGRGESHRSQSGPTPGLLSSAPHNHHHIPTQRLLFQTTMRANDLLQRERPGDHRAELALPHQLVDVLQEVAAVGGEADVEAGSEAERGAGCKEETWQRGVCDHHTSRRGHALAPGAVSRLAGEVEDNIYGPCRPTVLRNVGGDHARCPEVARQGVVALPADRGDARAERYGNLKRGTAHATAGADHNHVFLRLDLGDVAQEPERGGRAVGQRSCVDGAHGLRQRRNRAARPHLHELGVGPMHREPKHALPHFESLYPLAHSLDAPNKRGSRDAEAGTPDAEEEASGNREHSAEVGRSHASVALGDRAGENPHQDLVRTGDGHRHVLERQHVGGTVTMSSDSTHTHTWIRQGSAQTVASRVESTLSCADASDIVNFRTQPMRRRMRRPPDTTFDWNHARVLLAVARHGSYTAAALALGSTQPTIGRQIAAMEEGLGVTLVERVGRGVALTEAGHALAEHAREMEEGAQRLGLAASGHSTDIAGVVTLSSSEVFSAFLLPPLVATLRSEHPALLLSIVATSQISDLRRREADIALRHVRPDDPELIATRLPERRAHWYGTHEYLARIGHPDVGDSLDHVAFLGWDRSPRLQDMLASFNVTVTASNFPVVSDNQLVQWNLARAGLGLAVMEESVGDADPCMQRALPSCPSIPVPMWLATHREVRTSRRVRAVFDHLVNALRCPSEPREGDAAP